jgi:hypothetical protein
METLQFQLKQIEERKEQQRLSKIAAAAIRINAAAAAAVRNNAVNDFNWTIWDQLEIIMNRLVEIIPESKTQQNQK